MNYWTEGKENIWVAAHRGSSATHPENTMEAFAEAVKAGADQLETDVRITKDGELVLIHDATLERTTNGVGDVKDYTLSEIKALDAGSYMGAEFAGCKVPTLIEFMDYVAQFDTLTLDIELKEYPEVVGEEIAFSVCDRVMEIIDRYGYTDRVVINTFSAGLHEYIFKKYGKKYRQHVYFPLDRLKGEVTIDPYSYGYCCCMFNVKGHPVKIADKEHFDTMAAKGVEPWAGAFVKDEETVQLAIDRGSYLITCNNPAEVLSILRAKGFHK